LRTKAAFYGVLKKMPAIMAADIVQLVLLLLPVVLNGERSVASGAS